LGGRRRGASVRKREWSVASGALVRGAYPE
jgi:hypothetical protein